MPPIKTYRSPVLSLWQSAVNEVLARQAASQPAVLGDNPEPQMSSTAPIMLQSIDAAEAILSGRPAPAVRGVPIGDCAQLYLQLIVAQARGQADQVAELKNQIEFSTCDPLWAQCLIEYEKYRIFSNNIPYRRYQKLDDFVLSLPNPGADELRIALIADWGTGMPIAETLLRDAKGHDPHLLIHLGDIYYSGTRKEAHDNFLKQCNDVFGDTFPIFTLSGNHDMYSGGQGYYELLGKLGQPASYFCLRNQDWQLLALDTGLHDSDPGTVISNITYLDEQEVIWHQDKLKNAAGRRTILLSHHQLFAAAGIGTTDDGRPIAVNPKLQAAFDQYLDQIPLWMWGHEHNLIVYHPYAKLARGRCIGSGAVPILVEQEPYATAPNLVLPPGVDQPPPIDMTVQLANNGEFYSHAYAMLTLRGRAARIDYYQLELEDSQGALLYSEQIAAD
jgi:hypothetical protein